MPRISFALALVLPFFFSGPIAQATTLLVGSPSCTSATSHVCVQFHDTLGSAPVTIHSARWTFPSAGFATVDWIGSMQCENFSSRTETGLGVADLAFVVTRSARDTVNYEGRNGFRAAMRIPRSTPNSSNTTDVTTTIPVTISAHLYGAVRGGSNSYYLKMKILRLDANVVCTITTGSFTGVFNTQ